MKPSASPGHIHRSKILIVDDDPGQRSLLNSFLQGQGFQTEIAASGAEALEALSKYPADILISDVRMPGMSGLETLR
ncbi:MAG: response regulator, partial [Verrucomicrobia bacterium]|nr:response regulator [Verrucomicrobiota bacterium]